MDLTTAEPLLRDRLARTEERIAAACAAAGRPRTAVTLIAVTKTISAELTALLPQLGVADLAENRPQVLWQKHPQIPNVRWHFIGHLQRNKIERTIPLTALLHSADSPRLLASLNDFGREHNIKVPVLIEFNCSGEAAKSGLPIDDWQTIAEQLATLANLAPRGLMTMAAYGATEAITRKTFAHLRELSLKIQEKTGLTLPELSMGMSEDFESAIAEGSTMIRLGSVLFDGLGTP